MNIERLTILRDHLQKIDARNFNMTDWHEMERPNGWDMPQGEYDQIMNTLREAKHVCGSVACIGGWGDIIFENELKALTGPIKLEYTEIGHILGLTHQQQNQLFFPNPEELPGKKDMSEITLDEAIQTLTHLIETGEVNWKHSKE